MRRPYLISLVVLGVIAGCGGSSKTSSDGATDDGPGGGGGGGGGGGETLPAPPMLTITGTVLERTAQGSAPVPNATIAGYRNSDDTTAVAMTTSNAQGNFTLVVPTAGVALDGYLKATAMNLKTTYLYPPAPIAADTTAPVNMVSQTNLNLLAALANTTQQAGNGLIALIVVDGATAQSMPVAGATVSSTPTASAYRYDGTNTLVSATATATGPDGVAYMFNVPPDVSVTVSAMKTGSTFSSHSLKAWKDQFTTTLITP